MPGGVTLPGRLNEEVVCMVIELETACGCKRLMDVAEQKPPRQYVVPLRWSLAYPWQLDSIDIDKKPALGTRDRVFELRSIDRTDTGLIYRYREVMSYRAN